MNSERRHFMRVGFDAPAQLVTARGPLAVKVVDLSFKGALIELPADSQPAIGAHCALNVVLAETAATISMTGEVAHVEGRHLGLLCRSIDIDSVTHLRRLIEFHLGDPAVLERELKALVTY